MLSQWQPAFTGILPCQTCYESGNAVSVKLKLHLSCTLPSTSQQGIVLHCYGLSLNNHHVVGHTQTIAMQKDALLAGRQQDAARIQHLLEIERELRASLARQDATIAKQAATISGLQCHGAGHRGLLR